MGVADFADGCHGTDKATEKSSRLWALEGTPDGCFQGRDGRQVLNERVQAQTQPKILGISGTLLVAFAASADGDQVIWPGHRENELGRPVLVRQVVGGAAIDALLQA